MASHLRQAVIDSKIHLLHETFYFRSTLLRCISGLVLFVSLGLMSYNLWYELVDYSAEPITTYVANYETSRKFPKITLCPTNMKYKYPMIKEVVLRNMSAELKAVDWPHDRVISYFTSFETLSYFKGFYVQSALTDDVWKKFKDHVWNNVIDLGRNRTYQETEMILTVDFDSIIHELPGYPIINKERIMTVVGTCYVFDIDVTVPSILGPGVVAKFALPRQRNTIFPDNRETEMVYNTNADYLYLGEPGFWPKNPALYVLRDKFVMPDFTDDPSLYEPIRIYRDHRTLVSRRDYTFDVLVSSITFNRLNLRRRPCRDWSEQDRSICMVQCFNDEFCSKMDEPCLMFHPNQTREEQFGRLCSWVEGPIYFLTQNSTHCMANVWHGGPVDDVCEKRCPILCKEELYYYTHARAQNTSFSYGRQVWIDTSLAWANVTLRFQDPTRKLVIDEKLELTIDERAAQIGSGMSLWIGASGLAIAHLIVRTCFAVLRIKHE